MADLTRAEELVQAIEHNDAFQVEIQTASTVAAKRQVLDDHGFQDVTLDDMKAYVASKGGELVVPESRHELSDQELAAVAGGLTYEEGVYIGVGISGGVAIGVIASAVAAG